MAVARSTAVVLAIALRSGCTHLPGSAEGECAPDGAGFARSKTLLSWSAGRAEPPKEQPNGNGNGNGAASPEPQEEEPLASDRPDFTEASSTVGKGRVQLEAGYTFVR